MNFRLNIIVFLFLFVFLYACDEGTNQSYVPNNNQFISLNIQEVTLSIGESYVASYEIISDDYKNSQVKIYSKDTNIAKVDSSGNIIAVNVGKTEVVYQIDNTNIETYLTVIVKDKENTNNNESIPLNGFSLISKNITIEKGSIEILDIAYNPSNFADKDVILKSNDENIIEITEYNELYAKNIGVTTITVISKDGNHRDTCNVTVKPVYVSSIILPSEDIVLTVGEPYKLTPILYPEHADDKNLTYHNENSHILSITPDGTFTAHGVLLFSEVIITATGGAKKKIFISANKNKVISVNTTSINVDDNNATTKQFIVTKDNINSIYEIKDNLPDWLTYTKQSNNLTDTYTLNIKENTSSEERSAVITFLNKNGNTLYTINVTQKGYKSNTKTYKWFKGVTPPAPNAINKNYQWVDETGFFGWYNVVKAYGASTGVRDSNMCWAMAAASMLEWWSKQNEKYINKYKEINSNTYNDKCNYGYNVLADIVNKSVIGNLFRNTFNNRPGGTVNGLNWFISGTSYENVAGLGCYRDVFPNDFNSHLSTGDGVVSKEQLENHINEAIDKGEALAISYGTGGSSHVVVVWGAAYDGYNNITELYIADSNFKENMLYGFGICYKNGGQPYWYNLTAGACSNNGIRAIYRLKLGQDKFEEYFKNRNIAID